MPGLVTGSRLGTAAAQANYDTAVTNFVEVSVNFPGYISTEMNDQGEQKGRLMADTRSGVVRW